MRQTPSRIIFIVILFALTFGQLQASVIPSTCDEDSTSHSESIPHNDQDESDEHKDECCDVDCCNLSCPCSESLCSVALYVILSGNITDHILSNTQITRQFDEHPSLVVFVHYRPPIYTS